MPSINNVIDTTYNSGNNHFTQSEDARLSQFKDMVEKSKKTPVSQISQEVV